MYQVHPKPYPGHLAREIKVKWWSTFQISQNQNFDSIKAWISARSPKKSICPSQTSIWSQTTPPKFSFPINKAYKDYLRKLQMQAAETLSQLSDSNEDKKDTASLSLDLHNEDMCYGLPYTLLE